MIVTRRMLGMAAAIFVALVPLGAQAQDYPKMTIRFADIINRNFGYYQGMAAFKKEVEERSGGNITVDLISDGLLGGPKDVMEAAQFGAVEMAMGAASYTENLVPEHGIWNIPFVFANRDAWRKFAYSDLGQEVGETINSHGVKFLTWASAGGRGILAKKPIATPADLKGLKVRQQPTAVLVAALEAWGAQPVVMNLGDVYTSLEQGVLDAADLSVELVSSYDFDNTAKYYTELQHNMTAALVVANQAWWDGVDENTRQLLTEVITTTFRDVNDNWYTNIDVLAPIETQREQAKKFVDRGVTLVDPDRDAFREAASALIEQYTQKVGPDLVKKVQALAETN